MCCSEVLVSPLPPSHCPPLLRFPALHPSICLYVQPPSRIQSRRGQTTHRECQTPGAAKHPISKQTAHIEPNIVHTSLPVTSKRATICRVSSVVQSSVQIFLPRILCPVPRARSLQRMHACTHARGPRVSELSGTSASHLLLCIVAYKLDSSLSLTMDETSQPADP